MKRAKRQSAFTLVEMLAVVFIIAILVTIVVSVANYVIRQAAVKQTQINMAVIMSAIQEYNLQTNGYPAEAVAYSAGDNNQQARAWGLYSALAGPTAPASVTARLLPLDKNAIKMCGTGNAFVDGFEKFMDYRRNDGAGGTPVLVSAGPDGNFATDADNIRSDGR